MSLEVFAGKRTHGIGRLEGFVLKGRGDQRIASRVVARGPDRKAEVSDLVLVDKERAAAGIGHGWNLVLEKTSLRKDAMMRAAEAIRIIAEFQAD
ncbi:hypothetical protein [uncultured Novosphingobium sp.]|uniref:hypothetical protein n=1 Tax=uncultured Novosphingobium sp. TaxID=292277 RepID=UPI002589944B|nr:hypothetical protein [uncultured Novosphingobium sp.]